MKKVIVMFALSFIFLFVFTTAIAGASEDHDKGAKHFTNKSIKGMWGFSGSATVYPPLAPEPTPGSNLGTTYFDGKGNCVVKGWVSIGDIVLGPITSDKCTYSVNPDGTGSGTAYYSDPFAPESSRIEFVIVDHGRELRAIYSDPDYPICGGFTAKRQ